MPKTNDRRIGLRMHECLRMISAVAAVALLASGCSTSKSQPDPTPSSTVTSVTHAQIKSASNSPKALVPAGHWALVHRPKDRPIPAHTYLVRVVSVVKGASGDLKKVKLMGPEQPLSMKTAVPYYIAFQAAMIKGNPDNADGPGGNVAIDKTHDDKIGILQYATQFGNRCRPPTGGAGSWDPKCSVTTTCVVVATAPGAQYAPTALQVGLLEHGPAAKLKVPTPESAD